VPVCTSECAHVCTGGSGGELCAHECVSVNVSVCLCAQVGVPVCTDGVWVCT
jgi:hypothetical protein